MVGVGGYLDPSPPPAPHLYITNHLTSLTSFKTIFNIVYELPLFVVGVGGGRGGRGRGGWG